MKKHRKSATRILLATIVLTAGISLSAYAAEWKQDTTGWWYEQDGGGYATGWQWIDGKCYYFDTNGYMAANTEVDGYTLNSEGQWMVDGIVQTQIIESDDYTLGLNNTIWDLMNHTRAENIAKYGEEVNGRYPDLPYRIVYLRELAPYEDLMTEKPYRVILDLKDGELTKAFIDAPDPKYNDIYSAAEQLRTQGYNAEVKKVYPLGVYTCQLNIDRFVIRIRYGTETSVDIQQQEDEETAKIINDVLNSPMAGANTDSNQNSGQTIQSN